MIPEEIIIRKIRYIRGVKVILDSDLADMYGVETKRLKEQVKRNISRFPPHFMFELTKEEYLVLRSQIATLKQGAHSKYLPYAFSEHGVLMLSNVLRSEVAIQVSIRIIDVFVKMREMMLTQKDILHKIEHIENQLSDHSKEIQYLFSMVKQLLIQEEKPRRKIGYKQ
jgi:phage regulator Rha-like protein